MGYLVGILILVLIGCILTWKLKTKYRWIGIAYWLVFVCIMLQNAFFHSYRFARIWADIQRLFS